MERRDFLSQAAKQSVSEKTLCLHYRISMPVNVTEQVDEFYNTY